jgi:hypothetical protein
MDGEESSGGATGVGGSIGRKGATEDKGVVRGGQTMKQHGDGEEPKILEKQEVPRRQ